MLHIILIILKIIGIVLLAILGILVLLVCIVLFAPANYQIEGSARGTLESVRGSVRFSWLFHLVSGFVHYADRELEWQVFLLWKKINVPEQERVQKIKKEVAEDVEETIQASEEVIEQNILEDNAQTHAKKKKVREETVQKTAPHKKKASIVQKIKYLFQSVCDKIKEIRRKKENIEAFIKNEVHQLAFKKIKKEIFRFLKRLKPKRFHLKLHFGFEDPALTGKILGALCMLYPLFENNIEIEPEFDDVVLEGDIFVKGKVRCSYLVNTGIRLILDKYVRATAKELLFGKSRKKKRRRNKKN